MVIDVYSSTATSSLCLSNARQKASAKMLTAIPIRLGTGQACLSIRNTFISYIIINPQRAVNTVLHIRISHIQLIGGRDMAFYYLELVIFYNFVSLCAENFSIYTFRCFQLYWCCGVRKSISNCV